ncbi:hypothetical protein [Kitasatospora sp. NBC_00315]|uniref:hypothetical protein n=1 Tax=Kitasatospora sp. NBC_00315 TaxID=2975963 RepID=UPI00324DCB55
MSGTVRMERDVVQGAAGRIRGPLGEPEGPTARLCAIREQGVGRQRDHDRPQAEPAPHPAAGSRPLV